MSSIGDYSHLVDGNSCICSRNMIVNSLFSFVSYVRQRYRCVVCVAKCFYLPGESFEMSIISLNLLEPCTYTSFELVTDILVHVSLRMTH